MHNALTEIHRKAVYTGNTVLVYLSRVCILYKQILTETCSFLPLYPRSHRGTNYCINHIPRKIFKERMLFV